MDRQSAYRILNLKETATFGEARQAYRHLAKQYHPDVNRKKTGENDDGQMKQINLAFLYLTPILLAKKSADKIQKDQPNPSENRFDSKPDPGMKKKRPFLESFFGGLKQMALELSLFLKQEQTPAPAPEVKQTQSKSKIFQNPLKQEKKFSQVFKKVYKAQPESERKKTSHPGSRPEKKRPNYFSEPFQGYQVYMAYKKKMTAAKKRKNGTTRISRVEKIQPIHPVQPVQNNNR